MKLLVVVLLIVGAGAFAPLTSPGTRHSTLSDAIRLEAKTPLYKSSIATARARARPALLAASPPPAPPGGAPLTALLVAVWYATSVVCNQSSKVLVQLLGSQTLTLAQLVVAVACGAAVLLGLRASCRECVFPPIGISSRQQLIDTSLLATAFTAGFITLNSCLATMHVSLVMVLRAAEPLTTLALGFTFFGTRTSLAKASLLLVVVAGCALSAVGSFKATLGGVALAIISNVCFSLRGLLGKQLSSRYGGGDVEVFFQLCALGAFVQAAVLLATSGTSAFSSLASAVFSSPENLRLILVNGASFYAYLCLSWVCLGRMSAVSHSVANSLRRPVTVIAALLYSPVALTPTNLAGILLACAAAAVYGLI